MTEDYLGTESRPQGIISVDKMKTLDALKVMLRSQGETIDIIEKNLENIEKVVELIFLKLKKTRFGRIIYTGAGTSARIAVQDGVELFPTFGWPRSRVDFLIAGSFNALTRSIEGAEDDDKQAEKDVMAKHINSNDVIIGVAASANTPYTVSVIKKCQSLGALTVGIGNNINGKLQYFAEHSITLNTGSEIIAGSTRLKAGTSQKICLNLISTMVMIKMGLVKNGLMVNLIPTNKKLLKRKANIDKILSVLNK